MAQILTPPHNDEVLITEEYWRDQEMRRVANWVVYPAGLAYLGVCALLLFGPERVPEVVGAVCTDECGGARLFGVMLEWYGAASMLSLLVLRLAAQLTLKESLVGAAVSLAFIHGGASLALAGSQWFGFSAFCNLCQLAAALSFLIAAFHVGVAARAFRFPVVSVGQSVAVGFLAVVAAWPHFYSSSEDIFELETPLAPTATLTEPGTFEMAPRVAEPISESEEVVGATMEEGPQPMAATPAGSLSLLALGRVDAPYTLFVLSRMGCPVCARFESLTVPPLMRRAVASGQLRIQFLYRARGSDEREQNNQLIGAMALLGAGAPLLETVAAVQRPGVNVVSVPAVIRGAGPEHFVEGADSFLREFEGTVGWNAAINEQRRRNQILRDRYLNGTNATPSTVLMETPRDFANLPDASRVYSFVGFQIADPYLAFMGVE